VNHCPIGAELGWRNGSAKWPVYFFDSLPATYDVGRGSPTGVTFYQARQFPPEYRDNFLICDWSQGRILAVRLKRASASYTAVCSELVSGQPLNCTDIEVGPDGAVYFTTGGRGTQGGLYRVSRDGARPDLFPAKPAVRDALRFSSPSASFTRQRIEQVRAANPREWAATLESVARNEAGSELAQARARALEMLSQFGPVPSDELLTALAADADASIRARAVGFLGPRSSGAVRAALARALSDADPFVRRRACEGWMQQQSASIPVVALLQLLSEPDRWLRYAARVAIEHGEVEKYKREIMAIDQPRPLIEGMLALVRASRLDAAGQTELLEREALLLESPLPNDVACDLLRLIGLTYMLGPLKANAASSARLRPILLGLFSTATDSPFNREAARLLAFLQEPAAVSKILEHQASVPAHDAQIHDAYCLRAAKRGWSSERKRRLWAWYETASNWEGGYSFQGYLDRMIHELVALMDEKEREQLVSEGERFPFPTRVLVRAIDLASESRWVPALVSLYGKLPPGARSGSAADLRALIVEKLGRTTRGDARVALRGLYGGETDRRDQIARAIALNPTDQDIEILAQALDSRDLNTTSLVLGGLRRLKAVPAGPEALASLLRLARRVGPGMTSTLDDLARKWTGQPGPTDGKSFDQVLAAWEKVYQTRYPKGPAIDRAPAGAQIAYDLPALVEKVLESGLMKTASSERGATVIERAKCLECHKFGSKGAGVGPDLTTVSSRFRPIEILESMVEPSKVLSDQYRSVAVATADGKVYNGMPVVSDGPNLVLLLSDASKVTIPKDEIDSKKESAVSVMPEGLINSLSYQEIADLLALFNSVPPAPADQQAR
jgi:putative heme-binding domain-containing protein